MKNSFFSIFLALILISCSDSENGDCREVDYDKIFKIALGDEVCFPDGNSLTLEDIDYFVCPCMIECIEEFGLSTTLKTVVNENIEEREFYSSRLDQDRGIFDNHKIASFTFRYDPKEDELAGCDEELDPEKFIFKFTITEI